MHSKYTVVAVLLGCALGVAACVGPGENGMAEGEGEASAALNQIGAIERLGERTAPRIPTNGSAPSLVVDPSWPKPLPNDWRISQVGGIHVDQHDNIWVYHRSRALQGMVHVLVNGEFAIRNGSPTGAMAGRVITR